MTAPDLDVAAWAVPEPRVDPGGVAETISSLSNGYVGIRGTLDEVDPRAVVVDGTEVDVGTDPVRVPLREPAPPRPEPTQPEGREPRT